jgi:hypothetical protein
MTPTLSKQEQLAVRKRLLDDFAFWAKHCCKIRTKKGTIVPLVLNDVQVRFVERIVAQATATGRVRFVVLKARQQGLSTVISAWQYWWLSQRPAQKGLVMAHEADSTTTLFDMYSRIHDNAPEWVRPSTKYQSRNYLFFDRLDSALRVATAGGRGVARGETLTVAHLSEVAFWPVAFAAQNFNGLIQAVPDEKGTAVFLESTANGMTGKFREMWVNACKGVNGYEPFFSAWFESPEYRKDAPEGFTRTPDEQALAEKHGLDDAQLYWRRIKIGENGLEAFKQEYPTFPDEAFLSTGRPVFDPEKITAKLAEVKPPIRRMSVFNGSVDEHSMGELLVYVDHAEVSPYGELTGQRIVVDPNETYVIGADVGMGVRNGDPSCAQVLDSNLRQVAMWRGLIQPDKFADVLSTLGFYFNTALIAPERNNHGILTCTRLRDVQYPQLYTDQVEGTLEPEKDTIRLGFFTSEATKPLIIDKLRAVQRDNAIEINDRTTLEEMQTFVVTESGRLEAEDGCHDDTVIALAIANHIHEGKWTPVLVTDDFYTKAI